MLRHHKLYLTTLLLSLCLLIFGASQHTPQTNTIPAPGTIHVTAHKMTSKECSKIFGKNFISYAYQPITLTIYNDSDDVLLLRSASINMPLEQADTIIDATKHPVFWTTSLTTFLSAIYFWPAIIPSLCLGMWMKWNNTKLANKVSHGLLEEDMAIEILPYEQATRTFFVASHAVPDSCNFHLFNIDQKTFIPYNIALS
jgi:hypothetical protein